MSKVLIVSFGDAGNESEALRQTLEAFNCSVLTRYIGRPNDFIDVLTHESPINPDYIILSCHGDNGEFIMPLMGDEVYVLNEPKGNFSSSEIDKYLKLTGKVIISLGCTTGKSEMTSSFSKSNIYIAPNNYIDGNSALFFTIKFFYEVEQNKRPAYEAYLSAKNTDEQTSQFVFSK